MAERGGIFAVWSSTIATWVSIFGAAGGGYVALQTYDEEVAKMEDARVVQTFALYDMFNSAERLTARQRLFEHIQSDAELAASDLYIMLDFFDALQICISRDLCDQDLAVRLFQSYAVPFWDGLDSVIVNSRTDSDPYFGSGLEWLAGLPLPVRSDAPADPTAEVSTEEPQAEVVSPESAPAVTPGPAPEEQAAPLDAPAPAQSSATPSP